MTTTMQELQTQLEVIETAIESAPFTIHGLYISRGNVRALIDNEKERKETTPETDND